MTDLIFDKQPTGRTHQVGGAYEPITDESGEPEQEYALSAIVDGHRVPLLTMPVGVVAHFVGRPDTEVKKSSSKKPAEQPAG